MKTNKNPEKSTARRTPLAIAAVAAAALMAAGGTAYAAGISTDTQSGQRQAGTAQASGQASVHQDDDRHDDRDDDSRDEGQKIKAPMADAAIGKLHQAADEALAYSTAKGVSSISVERGGYEVEVVFADGDEQELFVAVDGKITAQAKEKQEADDSADPVLNLEKLEAVVKAASGAHQLDGARVESISGTDDAPGVYEVEFVSGSQDAEVVLNARLQVVGTDD